MCTFSLNVFFTIDNNAKFGTFILQLYQIQLYAVLLFEVECNIQFDNELSMMDDLAVLFAK